MNKNVEINDIEKKLNKEFIKQIEELPEEFKDPLENTIEYIKKRAVCNDYEAAQINALMSEQSAQKQGYKYYCRYIAGQSTPEEDNADYYKSIRKSWNRFLDKFSKMSLEERAEAFTLSINLEEIEKTLNNSSSEKLEYINGKTESKVEQIEAIANELDSKSTSYLVTHVNYTKRRVSELEVLTQDYAKSTMVSAQAYDIKKSYGSEESDAWETIDSVSADSYSNAINVVNSLKNIGKPAKVLKGPDTIVKNNTNPFVKGDLLQFKITEDKDSDENPIYRYVQVHHLDTKEEKGDTPNSKPLSGTVREVRVKPLEVEAWNTKGKTITSGKINSIRFKECEYHSMPIYIWYNQGDQDNTIEKDGWYLPNDWDYPNHIIKFDNQSDVLDGGKIDPIVLYTIYNNDCTGIEAKLAQIDKPDTLLLCSSILSLFIGLLACIAGLLSIIATIFGKSQNTTKEEEQPLKDGVDGNTDNVENSEKIGKLDWLKRNPLVLTGSGLFISGAGLITTGIIGIVSYNTDDSAMSKIHDDIQMHNTELFDALPIEKHGWITHNQKTYFMVSCEAGTLSVGKNPLKDTIIDFYELGYTGHNSRYGKDIPSPRRRTNQDQIQKDDPDIVIPMPKIPSDEGNIHTQEEGEKTIRLLLNNINKNPKKDIITQSAPNKVTNKEKILVGYGYQGIMGKIGLDTGSKTNPINQANIFLRVQIPQDKNKNKEKIEFVAIAFQPKYTSNDPKHLTREEHKITTLRKKQTDEGWEQWNSETKKWTPTPH
jgi:hypothetical protein